METQIQQTIESNLNNQAPDQIQTTKSKPKINFWVVSTITLLIILILSSTFFWFSLSEQKKAQQITSLSPLVSPIPQSAIQDEVEISNDWKSYANTAYKYSLKYPSDWQVVIQGESKWEKQGFPSFGPAQSELGDILTISYFEDESGIYDETGKEMIFDPQEWQLTSINDSTAYVKYHLLAYDQYIDDYVVPLSTGKYLHIQLSVEDPNRNINSNSLTVKTAQKILFTLELEEKTISETQITTPQINGVDLKEIKYTLPASWKTELYENTLLLSAETGGYLAISVYDYSSNIGRRAYYCQVRDVCIDTSIFTETKIGNISGYSAEGIDNSGGGIEYFGTKGNKFYVISSYSPPSSSDFDSNYQSVLNSLIF